MLNLCHFSVLHVYNVNSCNYKIKKVFPFCVFSLLAVAEDAVTIRLNVEFKFPLGKVKEN